MKANEEQPAPDATAGAVWCLHILGCCDGSFYTGVTTDIGRRLRERQEGTASRYTRIRRPIVLVYQEECGTRPPAPGGHPKIRWLFGPNPDIHTVGNDLPAGKRKLCIIENPPENRD